MSIKKIEKINFSYPKGTLQSVYDTEEMTALELAAKTSKKVDECVDMVNGVEQIAIDATAIVDEMRIAQDQFMIDNIDYIKQDVNTKVDALISDGTIESLINDEIIGKANAAIDNNSKAFAEATGAGVVNGLEVLQQSAPNMTVLISTGVAHLFNGKRYELLENATATIDAADALYPRIDIIYISSNGVLTYGKGEVASTPIAPTPVNGLTLAEVYVDKTDTVVTTSMITDKRKMKNSVEGLKPLVDTHASQLAENAKKHASYVYITDKPFEASPNKTAEENDVAIQNAINSLTLGQRLIIPTGTFQISNVVFDVPDYCSLECHGTLISNATSGVAFKIGNDTTSSVGLTIEGLDVRALNQIWAHGVIGVQVVNTYDSDIGIKRVLNFYKNIELNGKVHGVSYNRFYISRSDGGKKSIFLTSSNGGWVNENSFYGGEFKFNSTDPVDSDCCLLTIDDSGGYKQNNNHFYSPSFERGKDGGAKCAYITGVFNLILHARTEQTGVIELASGATYNTITLGFDDYQADVADIIVDNGSQNTIQTSRQIKYSSAVNGVMTIQNVGSSNSKNIVSQNIVGTDTFSVKASGEVYSANSGYFTNGIRWNSSDATYQDRGLFSGSGSPEGVISARVGSLYADTSGGSLYAKSSGISNIGWRVLQPILATTSTTRPSSPPTGYSMFDVQLGKPIWFNGTNWVDATGATV